MPPPIHPTVAMGFYFYPRGGSAQVVRYLCRALSGGPWSPTLYAGSLGPASEYSNAGRFFAGVRCCALDYTPSADRWASGGDPMSGAVPMAASYEDKGGVPDPIFVNLDDAAFLRQVESWTQLLSTNTVDPPSLVHLHHLTPLHEAVHQLWPDVPVITHLHGTELTMLAAVEDGRIRDEPGRFGRAWVGRMRRWAAMSDRVVTISAQNRQLALDLLPVDRDRVTTLGNGVDVDLFAPRHRSVDERLAHWKRMLVDDPRGWRPGGAEGSIAYRVDDLAPFTDEADRPVPVVVYAGRFMRIKRVQLLIEAHHALRATTTRRSVLVIVGGFPGEWEGEHPCDTVRRLGAADVYFVGWRDHDDLAETLACSDVFVAPSVEEPFGLIYLEAMAAGLPPIATNTGGPPSFINVDREHPTGWLVQPDDADAIADALTEALADPRDRAARGRRAAEFVRAHYSWASAASEFARLYREVVDNGRSSPVSPSA